MSDLLSRSCKARNWLELSGVYDTIALHSRTQPGKVRVLRGLDERIVIIHDCEAV